MRWNVRSLSTRRRRALWITIAVIVLANATLLIAFVSLLSSFELQTKALGEQGRNHCGMAMAREFDDLGPSGLRNPRFVSAGVIAFDVEQADRPPHVLHCHLTIPDGPNDLEVTHVEIVS